MSRAHALKSLGKLPILTRSGVFRIRHPVSGDDAKVLLRRGSSVAAPPGGTVNASTYAGGTLDATGSIQGFAYYAVLNKHSPSVSPVFNPSNLPAVAKVDPVQMPDLSIPHLLAQARNSNAVIRETIGDVRLEGEIRLGTADSPLVWHVAGNIRSFDAVTFTGYGGILVDGQTWLRHPTSTAPNSEIAVFSGAELWASRATSIVGHLFSESSVYVEGHLTGSATAGLNVEVGMNGSIDYRPVSCVLSETLWPTGLCSGI